MSFLDISFPTNIRHTLVTGPEFCTTVSVNKNKNEIRNSLWLNARRRYNINYELCNKEEAGIIITFFQVCKGKLHGFRYRDWSDYECFDQYLGTGNGFNRHFLLSRDYVFGSHKVSRAIAKPVHDTVKVMINNVLQSDSILSIDYNTGEIVFERAPLWGDIVSASFTFDTPVRFDIDFLSIGMAAQGRYSIREISLVELTEQ